MSDVRPPLTVDVSELPGAVNSELGPTSWLTISQSDVDAFGRLTRDCNFLHVDQVRAAASPFGGTIAHGFLTVGMLAALLPSLLVVKGAAFSVNYGIERLRFPAPVLVGTAIRLRGVVAEVKELDNGMQVSLHVVAERSNGAKPGLVATWLFRYYLDPEGGDRGIRGPRPA